MRKKIHRMFALAGGLVLLALLCSSTVRAQVSKAQLDAAGNKLQAARTVYDKLPPENQKAFSGGATNFFHALRIWPEIERKALSAQASGRIGSHPHRFHSHGQNGNGQGEDPGTVRVNDPSTDFAFGPSGGFTQSETSTAWCGSHVVVGFNDSGSLFASGFPSSFLSLGFSGYALSTNQAGSFTDEGFLPPSVIGNFLDALEGDPSVACSDPSTFYYSSVFFGVTGTFFAESAVTVSKSTDGGATFGSPVVAVAKDANTHALDKDWMALNPANPNQIAVTYTDFDVSGTICGFGIERVGVEIVGSTDGGARWSAPTEIFHVCDNMVTPLAAVQGSQVAFSPSGAVNVAFELYSNGLNIGGRAILFAQAPSLGSAFGPPSIVAPVTGVGDGFLLQGGFRASIDFQGMAVDRSGKSSNGNIYLVWHDTDANDSTQVFNGNSYLYSDVWLAKSSDNGASWSAPVQIDNNREPMPNGLGTDSYMPGVAVDNTTGAIAVCWYDRRHDPKNFAVDRFCGQSLDGGASFTNFPVTGNSFLPIHGADDLTVPQYMGDYDSLASDVLRSIPGFIGAFQIVEGRGASTLVPNSNVVATTFQ